MKKIIHLKAEDAGKLNCDNTACNYTTPELLPFNESLINHECPKCGSNMLTLNEYSRVVKLIKMVAWINKWFGWLGTEDPSGISLSVKVSEDDIKVTKN